MRWILALITVTACSKEAERPAPSPLVGASRALATQMCACRDTACADRVEVEWNANAEVSRELSAEDVEAIAEATQRYTKCLAALR